MPKATFIERVRALNIVTYKYKPYMGAGDRKRIGPMADQWSVLFGGSTTQIDMQDAIGVLLATIKELDARIQELERDG